MCDTAVIKICPEERQLGYVGPATCPTCGVVLSNSASCEMHQIKKHNKESTFLEKKGKGTYQYFCPVGKCKYNLLGKSRYFSTMKYLKQHYLKTHAERKFVCTECSKNFATQVQLSSHSARECGVKFGCIQCDISYSTREALLTHCARTGHINSTLQIERKGKIEFVLSRGQFRKILRKPRGSDHLMENIAAAALSELSRKAVIRTGIDIGTQTQSGPDPRRRAKVDTCEAVTNTSSTQTVKDELFPEEADSDSLMTDMVLRQYFTSATQTSQDVMFDLGMFQDIEPHVNNETQTNLILDDDCPALSNTHTQTADLDEYRTQTQWNNCTQTCDDIFLNDFVELSDIETQTAWASLSVDSFLVSAQTQTLL